MNRVWCMFGNAFKERLMPYRNRSICNVNELTRSYIVRAFIERYFRKNIVVCSWIPSSKKDSYHKETSQLIYNTNSVGFCWKALLHRLWLTSPTRMDFFSVSICYTLKWNNLQSPDTNIIFVASGREKIKIIKSALLRYIYIYKHLCYQHCRKSAQWRHHSNSN